MEAIGPLGNGKNARGLNRGYRGGANGRGRHGGDHSGGQVLADAFIIEEPESLVFDDRAAGGSAVIVTAERQCAMRYVEEIASVQVTVADEVISRSMQAVGARRVMAFMMPPVTLPYSAAGVLLSTENS